MYRSDRASLHRSQSRSLESGPPATAARGAGPRAAPPAAVSGATRAWVEAGSGVLRTHFRR